MHDPAETLTEWRIRGGSLVARLASVVIVPLNLGASVLHWISSNRDGFDLFRLVAWSVATVAIGLLLVVTLRTRVVLRPEGVEVRELRTRVFAWADIADVRVDRRAQGTIRLDLVDGDSRALPAPTRMRPKASDTTIVDAVTAIEYRRLLAG